MCVTAVLYFPQHPSFKHLSKSLLAAPLNRRPLHELLRFLPAVESVFLEFKTGDKRSLLKATKHLKLFPCHQRDPKPEVITAVFWTPIVTEGSPTKGRPAIPCAAASNPIDTETRALRIHAT